MSDTPIARLAEKLQQLDLSPDEVDELDRLLARAEAYDDVPPVTVTSDELIPAAIQNAIVVRTAKAARVARSTAAAAFCDTLSLLEATALDGSVRLSPSAIVDEAWHQFILFTREYAAYCDAIAGRPLHHMPHVDGMEMGAMSPSQSYEYLLARDYPVTASLWDAATSSPALARLTNDHGGSE